MAVNGNENGRDSGRVSQKKCQDKSSKFPQKNILEIPEKLHSTISTKHKKFATIL
jgi:hypothetical protein